jgi:hypothetical protein
LEKLDGEIQFMYLYYITYSWEQTPWF